MFPGATTKIQRRRSSTSRNAQEALQW